MLLLRGLAQPLSEWRFARDSAPLVEAMRVAESSGEAQQDLELGVAAGAIEPSPAGEPAVPPAR
jgi:hypothetical protein